MNLWGKKRRSKEKTSLSLDEVFLDTTEIPGLSREQFDGMIEKPIHKGMYYSTAIILTLTLSLFMLRTLWLQVVRGEELRTRSEDNFVETTFFDAPRGVIYDRKGVIIASNEAFIDDRGIERYRRKLRHSFAFSHIIGFIGKPSDGDEAKQLAVKGIFEFGKSGIEQFYNNKLQGTPGEVNQELDATGSVVSEGVVRKPIPGDDITLTIDAELQEKIWSILDERRQTYGFIGGSAVVFDIKTGGILSMVNVPSYDLDLFTKGLDQEAASAVFNDQSAPLFNRAVAGRYAPGSIIKPFVALAALEEKIIDEKYEIYSAGALTIPDPYREGRVSTFKDWKAHGYVDMRRALAVSSDVYFYTIGGGHGPIRGLGIQKLGNWLRGFGFSDPTHIDIDGEVYGFIPDPEWKEKAHIDNPIWRIGDTYNVSIGQGDVLVTPISVARALGTLATRGSIPQMHLHMPQDSSPFTTPHINESSFQVVEDGMISATREGGTAVGVGWMPFTVAAKTGTAEVGNKDRIHSWVIGYAPAQNPRTGFVFLMESGKAGTLVGATAAASEMFQWLLQEKGGLEYFGP